MSLFVSKFHSNQLIFNGFVYESEGQCLIFSKRIVLIIKNLMNYLFYYEFYLNNCYN